MAAEFTHLHLHTDYSLLDGACDVDKLAKHLDKIGQKAAAITDHGNIYGAVHFFDAMKKRDLKPILGCELYVCKEEDHRGKPDPDSKYNHMLVLAESEAGYKNLVRLTSEAALHGFYRKPRVSQEVSGGACGRIDRILRVSCGRGLAEHHGRGLRSR